MTETSDGFLISEADMKMRGPGDMEGTQQSGIAFNLKVANLASDGQIVSLARNAADIILNAHPELIATGLKEDQKSSSEKLPLDRKSVEVIKRELNKRFARIYDWSQIS